MSQLLLDGLLVAVAYLLAFQLRFDGAAPPNYVHLLDATLWWVIVAALATLAAFGLYQRGWAYVGRRGYEAVVKAVVVATVVVVVAITVLHPVLYMPHAFRYFEQPPTPVTLPAGVIALFLLLQLALLFGARFVVQLAVVGLGRTA